LNIEPGAKNSKGMVNFPLMKMFLPLYTPSKIESAPDETNAGHAFSFQLKGKEKTV
jgi:hypothetical protein